MKIAISTDGNFVSAHFGRCPSFTIVEIENGELLNKQVIPNPGHHPGFLPQFLHEKGVSCIIAGGAGQRALNLFAQQNIQVMVGISGTVDEVIDKAIKGTLRGGDSFCRKTDRTRAVHRLDERCHTPSSYDRPAARPAHIDLRCSLVFGRCPLFASHVHVARLICCPSPIIADRSSELERARRPPQWQSASRPVGQSWSRQASLRFRSS